MADPIDRSGSYYSSPRDANRVPATFGVSTVDGITPVPLEVNPANGQLQVNAAVTISGSAIPASGLTTAVAVQIVDGSGNQITSFGGGTQYTDGGTPPTHPIAPTLVYDNSGTWTHVSVANPLPVTGGGGGTQYTQGSSTVTHPVGTMPIFDNGGTIADVTAAQGLPVNIVQSGTTVTISGTVTANAGTNLNTSLLATSANLTAGTQKTQIVDGSGSVIASTSNALNVSANITGGSIANTTFAVTNAGTFAVQDTVLDAALIAQEATTSGVKGLTVFGAVTTNAPTYTTAKSDALSLDTSGLLRISLKDTPANTNKLLVTADAITVAASQTIAVTNTGTFAVQATLAAETTKVIGTVNQGTSPWVVSNGGTFAVQAAQSGSWTMGTTSAAVNVGQKTVSTTAVQISAGSTVPTNGIIVKALSTNSAPIFVGGSSVTTSNGYELVAGESISFTANLNTLYIISTASTTDKIAYNVE